MSRLIIFVIGFMVWFFGTLINVWAFKHDDGPVALCSWLMMFAGGWLAGKREFD